MNTTSETMNHALGERAAAADTTWWPAISRRLVLFSQLALALLVIYLYQIEGAAFLRLFALACAGFLINLAIPIRYRLPFFAVLSLGGIFTVFGAADGAWLVAAGTLLIALCHLPVPFAVRVALILCVALLLAVSRGGLLAAPWSGAVWPILGSMFMFRLVLYLMAVRAGQTPRSPWSALAYFFMLPNLVFPLYPVIDYQTFRRTHYDKDEWPIYEQGLLWISRGLVHLCLYRFVYHSVLNDPVDVVRLGDLVQFMVGTFLLYLRVSGQFHLIVGILHLFGFRLPETHKRYYLAHSYVDLWRRINIYWTDFMMKTVFYPAYFRVKRFGPVVALAIATSAVFVTTWILHSYQWFWLRGGFPLTAQDTLFWGILGALVLRGAIKELKTVRKARPQRTGWDWKLGLKSVVTFFSFCFLWSLWSTESVTQWVWMLGAAADVDAKGIVLLAATAGIVWYFGGREGEVKRGERPRWAQLVFAPATRTLGALGALLLAAHPGIQASTAPRVAEGLRSMQMTGLNARDAAVQHRGYYEQLEVRGPVAGQVADALRRDGEQWDNLASIGMLRERSDMLQRDLLPSRSATWNGNLFSTNRWGMRDKEYPFQKAPGTLRIALLGPSHVMGNGVPDGATFESLVEERLNRDFRRGSFERVEILNFGVDGFSFVQQVAMLEDRVLAFAPDVVIATHYQRNRQMTERYLQKLAWSRVQIPYPPLRALVDEAGLTDMGAGRIPVPFESGRRLARSLGIEPRMPAGEAAARTRRIADDVLRWSIAHFAEVTKSRGIVPVMLALNAVIEDVPSEVPHLRAMQQANVRVIDLFDVFPEAERASLRVAPWDDHPNIAGHRLIADRLYPPLVSILESSVGDRAATK